MPTPRCRPFTVSDGMILTAAAAVGIWLILLYDREGGSSWLGMMHHLARAATYRDLRYGLLEFAPYAQHLLLPLGFALVVVRLRRPRPSLRRLAHQPGFAACFAALLVAFVSIIGSLFSMAERAVLGDGYLPPSPEIFIYSLLYDLLAYPYPAPGAAVTAVWGVMLAGSMCRREPGWIDRAGRAVGACWLFTSVLRQRFGVD